MIYKDKECFQPFSVNDSENGNDCFDNYPFQRDMDLYCDLLDQLSKMGIEVTAMHTEWAPGQWEMVTEPMQGMHVWLCSTSNIERSTDNVQIHNSKRTPLLLDWVVIVHN